MAPARPKLSIATIPAGPVSWPKDAEGIAARLLHVRGPKETPRHVVVTHKVPPALPKSWSIGLGMNMGETTPEKPERAPPGMVTLRDFFWLGVIAVAVLVLA